jgi:flagellar biosynthesis protein FlhB
VLLKPLAYSSATEYIVIVIVAVAEALLASLLATSLLGMLASATEMSISIKLSRTDPIRRIARMIGNNDLFTLIPSRINYTTSQP